MRIGYWSTSSLEPETEAVSKEVFGLAEHFSESFIFAVSPHLLFRFSLRKRYIGFHQRLDPLLRVIVRLAERRADINHVYGHITPWLFHKCLREKPIVHTIASEKGEPVLDFLARCRAVVVQTAGMRDRLTRLGVEGSRLHLVYPGADLDRFKPEGEKAPLPGARILFATAPRSSAELETRGVPLLLETARVCPDVEFHLLFRKWAGGSSSRDETERRIRRLALQNVTLTHGHVIDMAALYRSHHLTVIPYTKADGGKECPNSLVESLACGTPVLVSAVAPMASFVAETKTGEVFEPTPAGLADGIDRALSNRKNASRRCAEVARRFFSQTLVVRAYRSIYENVLGAR